MVISTEELGVPATRLNLSSWLVQFDCEEYISVVLEINQIDASQW